MTKSGRTTRGYRRHCVVCREVIPFGKDKTQINGYWAHIGCARTAERKGR